MRIWEGATGKQRATWEGTSGEFADFSARGDLLAATGGNATTRLWDPATGKERLRTTGMGCEFSLDDRWLGFGLYGSCVGRWEVAAGGEYRRLYGRPRVAAGGLYIGGRLDVSPDGRLLASVASDGVRLWDLAAGKLVTTLPTGWLSGACFDPRRRFLITCGPGGLARWPMRPGKEGRNALRLGPPEFLRVPPGLARPSLSADGQALIAQTFDGHWSRGQFAILELEKPDAAPRWLDHPPAPTVTAVFSPDAKWVA